MARATIKDIAKETGLGLATISSYLNGGNVREYNRSKIEEAIQKLNFEVNEVARGLKTNKTQIIGVVIPELNNTFCTQIITEMEDILRKHGYATIVCDCRTDKALEKEAVDFLKRKRVEGIINMPVDATGNHLKSFIKNGHPVVLIDRDIAGVACDSVLVDNRQAAYGAVTELIRKGHKRIGMIVGPKDIYTAKERLLGYQKAMEEAGYPIEESLIMHCDYSIKESMEASRELFAKNPKMTAVFATNYEITVGAMICANEENIKVPGDVSIIGFDNVEFARAVHPTLTIVTQPMEEIARHAAKLMLKRIKEAMTNKVYEKETVSLQTNMMYGKSVKNISSGEDKDETISVGN